MADGVTRLYDRNQLYDMMNASPTSQLNPGNDLVLASLLALNSPEDRERVLGGLPVSRARRVRDLLAADEARQREEASTMADLSRMAAETFEAARRQRQHDQDETARLRAESGSVDSDDPLVSFLYELMRDHVPVGVVEQAVSNSPPGRTVQFTNGWLASYAADVATRLRSG